LDQYLCTSFTIHTHQPTMSLLRAAPLRIARSMPVARQQVRFAHVENVVDQYVKG
jgi:hypothetical protein